MMINGSNPPHTLHRVNSLCPSEAILLHENLSTLIKEIAWCLAAPSHYLKHC